MEEIVSDFSPCPKADLYDKAYDEHIRTLCRLWKATCFSCGARDGTVVGHHVRAKRRFGDKWNEVYLCNACHRDFHDHGPTAFHQYHGLSMADLKAEAVRLYDKYLEIIGENGGTPS